MADDDAIAKEWERMQGIGRRIQRKRIVAGAVASLIFLVGVAIAIVIGLATPEAENRRAAKGKAWLIAIPLVISWSIAGAVGKKMWPKFGGR